MSFKKLTAIGMIAMFLSGCATNPEVVEEVDKTETNKTIDDLENNEILSSENPVSLSSLNDVIFELELIDGKEFVQDGEKTTISFSYTSTFGDIIRGYSGCNYYFTPYSTQRSVLITGEFVATDNKCTRNDSHIESFLFNIFSEKPILSFESDTLKLKAISNELTFIKVKKDKKLEK